MAAINLTPQATNRVSDTQAPILANFNSINVAFNLNHGDFGSADEGKHKILQMPAQTAGTGDFPATGLDEYGIFAYNGQLYSRYPNQADTNAIQDATDTPFTQRSFVEADGYCFLPNGMLIKWGYEAFNIADFSTAVTVTYAGGPAFTHVHQVLLTACEPEGGTGTAANIATALETNPTGTASFNFYVRKVTGTAPIQGRIRWMAFGDIIP